MCCPLVVESGGRSEAPTPQHSNTKILSMCCSIKNLEIEFFICLWFRQIASSPWGVRGANPISNMCSSTRGASQMFNSFRGQGRANYSNGAGIRAARLRRDLSALFVIPNVPPSTPMAPQPDGFRGRLFDYQRRSLHRMLEIEREGGKWR